MIAHNISLMMFIFLLSYRIRVTSGQFSFSQPAIGPSSVCEGSIVTLQCRIVFNGSVRSSVWFRNGTAVRVGNSIIPNHFINSTGGFSTDLVITDVTMADNNTVYTCSNIDDSITSSVVLNVSGPPSINSVTYETCLNYIMLTWNVTNDQKACGNALCNLSVSSDGIVKMTGIVNDTFYKFLNLTPETNYSVSILSSNSAGSGQSYTGTIRTAPNTTIAEVVDINSTYIVIQIIPINEMFCGGAVTYTTTVSPPHGQIDAISQTVYNITGLRDNTTYAITTFALRRSDIVHSVTIIVSTLQSQTKCSDPTHATVYNVTISSSLTPGDLSGFDIIISWARPVIDPCTTLPVTGYYIYAIVTNSNGDDNERIYTSNYINDSLADSMGRFSVSYDNSFDQELEPNAVYAFIVNTQDDISEIPRTGTCPSCDDKTSTGTAIAISIVITFIITLVVSALITCIIVSMYYKYLVDNIRKPVIGQGDSHTLTEGNTKYDLATTTMNITMDTNPAYGTANTIKMNTNPAYATMTTT